MTSFVPSLVLVFRCLDARELSGVTHLQFGSRRRRKLHLSRGHAASRKASKKLRSLPGRAATSGRRLLKGCPKPRTCTLRRKAAAERPWLLNSRSLSRAAALRDLLAASNAIRRVTARYIHAAGKEATATTVITATAKSTTGNARREVRQAKRNWK